MTQPILPYEGAALSLSAWLDDWCGLQIAHDERPALRLAQFHRYRRSLPTVLKTNIAFALAMTVILIGPGYLWFVLGWGEPSFACPSLDCDSSTIREYVQLRTLLPRASRCGSSEIHS